jgi:3-deoxy-7-phosphoheptulonate synthase
MSNYDLLDTRIETQKVLITPKQLKEVLPLTSAVVGTIEKGRRSIQNILDGKDLRKLLIVGPCSIHDTAAAIEYADKLKYLADKVKDQLLIVMRVYFEKPRTVLGWKGLINDPDLDDSFNLEKGLLTARKLLLNIAEIGLPTATEALDPITPQYVSELISWAAIGARTIESQTHREMASGLSMPVGFKNGTDGNIQVAIDAILASREPHNFLGIDQLGQINIFNATGNAYGHIILRGGGGHPNYDSVTVSWVEKKLRAKNLPIKIIIDCSHGNSYKNHKLQSVILENILQQIEDGNHSIIGAMIESNLYEGSQNLSKDLTELEYGISITDGCIGWNETENIILSAYDRLNANREVTMSTCGLRISGVPVRNLMSLEE